MYNGQMPPGGQLPPDYQQRLNDIANRVPQMGAYPQQPVQPQPLTPEQQQQLQQQQLQQQQAANAHLKGLIREVVQEMIEEVRAELVKQVEEESADEKELLDEIKELNDKLDQKNEKLQTQVMSSGKVTPDKIATIALLNRLHTPGYVNPYLRPGYHGYPGIPTPYKR